VHEVVAVVQVNEPGDDVTVYPVIEVSPVTDGAVQDTVACVLPEVAETDVGAPGTEDAAIAEDALDADPVPTAFVALTVNVYEAPFVSPVTVHEVLNVEQSDGAAPIGTIR
jgi:hypothetical protein